MHSKPQTCGPPSTQVSCDEAMVANKIKPGVVGSSKGNPPYY